MTTPSPGLVTEIWLTAAAAAPMRRGPSAPLLARRGLEGDRHAPARRPRAQ